MTSELERFNALPTKEAEARLSSCCASSEWARRMAAARPFGSFRDLADEANRVWRSLSREDWLEAFAAHPRIGAARTRPADLHPPPPENVTGTGPAGLHPSPNFVAFSREEQGGTRGTSPETLANLADANRDYEERFGHIFVVFASGRNAAEMLGLVWARLGNDPAAELAIAVEEQRKITRLRLEKLLTPTEK
ncbi:MAG TPA: 2-oxo-4-hydroxy-4-carboxy-5-ureidoimidazoline decarboxylase [Thermoanaerobaculia bacterium]